MTKHSPYFILFKEEIFESSNMRKISWTFARYCHKIVDLERFFVEFCYMGKFEDYYKSRG